MALILLGEKNPPHIPSIIKELNASDIPFIGGVFPGLIYDDACCDQGAVVLALPFLCAPAVIKDLNTSRFDVPKLEEEIIQSFPQKYTAIILADGLAPNIGLFLSEVFNTCGNAVNYFGGGAGSVSLRREPCVFSSEGFFQDAAVIGFVKLETCLGVRHGWERILGPIVATKTSRNVIHELNWEKAFDVYKRCVESDSGRRLTRKNFYSIAKGYPFGINREGEEDIVRDPVSVDAQGGLVCVGEVPENAALGILKGRKRSLIQAAGQAVEDCAKAGPKTVRQVLVADCISRALFLEKDFSKELKSVKGKICVCDSVHVPEGMLTIGEISSYGEGSLEFFNKTIVLGVLHAR